MPAAVVARMVLSAESGGQSRVSGLFDRGSRGIGGMYSTQGRADGAARARQEARALAVTARAARCRTSCLRDSRTRSRAPPSAGTCRRRCSRRSSTPRGISTRSRDPAGAQGIAQFMPGTAAAYGLANPFDAERGDRRPGAPHARPAAAVRGGPARARGVQRRPGAGRRCGCVPPYPETRAYVARILGLLGGAGEAVGPRPA